MRQSAVKSGCLSADAEEPKLLVLGYEGTLQPDHASCRTDGLDTCHVSGERSESGRLPPQMDWLVEPLLAKALLRFEHQTPDGQRVLSGERIPVDALLKLLRQRLYGILTLAVAAYLTTAHDPTTLTEQNLTSEFAALSPLLQQAVSEWVSATAAFHDRLHRDRSRLAEWLGVACLPPVESLSGTTSDTHPGGHLVLRIVLKGGRCIYYKPRSVSGEWLWHRLLECIAEAEPALRLPAGRVLKGGLSSQYGWAESVNSLDRLGKRSQGIAGGHEYWHAAGAMLCLAHHVSLTDLHLGNVIATPNGPAVTDAECLGTPRFLDSARVGNFQEDTRCSRLVESLMDTGLLRGKSVQGMPDISGLFGTGGTVSRLRLPQWIQEPGGRYRLKLASAVLTDHGNAPGVATPLTVLPQLLAGYRQAAGVLLRCRKSLFSSGSQWRSVLEKDHAPRVVVRDTLCYSLMLSESLGPRFLRSKYRRRTNLRRALQRDAPKNIPYALLRTQLSSLLNLHVPRLIVPPGTRTLASSSGRPLASKFASCAPAEEVIRRMEELSADSLEAIHIPALVLAVFRSLTPS